MLMSAGVDTDNPQLAEIALLVLAIAVGVLPAALDVFLCGFPELAPCAERATGCLHYLLFALQAHHIRSYARHFISPLKLQEPLDVLFFTAHRDRRRLTQAALPLRRLLGEDVTLERLEALDLTRACDREALSRSAVAFHLRHVLSLLVVVTLRSRPTSARGSSS